MPHTAAAVTTSAMIATLAVTATRRAEEYGSSSFPATAAVMTKPQIIIIHVIVAAAGRRSSATRCASRTSSVVPEAPTPMPTAQNASAASSMPPIGIDGSKAIASAASTAPAPRTAMPPMIHGVRRPPTSEP